jgi:hypothetical protein
MSYHNQYPSEQTLSFGTSTESSTESYPSDYAAFINEPLPPIPHQPPYTKPLRGDATDDDNALEEMLNNLHFEDTDETMIGKKKRQKDRDSLI